jgi:hypothetical protein
MKLREVPSPASLRSAPSPAMQERGYKSIRLKLLSDTAGEGSRAPTHSLPRLRGREWVGAWWVRAYVLSDLDKAAAQSPTARRAAAINRP